MRKESEKSAGSAESEEWFVAMEEPGGQVERGESVRGLLREGMRRRQEKRLEEGEVHGGNEDKDGEEAVG